MDEVDAISSGQIGAARIDYVGVFPGAWRARHEGDQNGRPARFEGQRPGFRARLGRPKQWPSNRTEARQEAAVRGLASSS